LPESVRIYGQVHATEDEGRLLASGEGTQEGHMLTLRTARAVSTGFALMLAASPALAAEPTLSDIAGCNEQAAAKTSASALPHPGTRVPDRADQNSPASPRADATRPGIVPGPADRGVADAPKSSGAAPLPGTGGPGEKTDPTGSVISESPDPLVKGMAAEKADDPQYRAAYRECMRGKIGGR